MKNKHITLTKLQDENIKNKSFKGIHIDSVIRGFVKEDPEKGKQLFFYDNLDPNLVPMNWTSEVINYNEKEGTLKTKNSLYKVTIK